MNFNSQTSNSSSLLGSSGSSPKGMWCGYGDFCTGSTGLWLELKESYPKLTDAERLVTGSLIDICGFKKEKLRIGEIADEKIISEAIVVIPFIDEPQSSNNMAKTIKNKVVGKNFFSLLGTSKTKARKMFNMISENKRSGLDAITKEQSSQFGVDFSIPETSISDLSEKMDKYIIPPELDFKTFNSIDPFVMYILEFEHKLDRQDLADIWQGVMPKIATIAEKAEEEISHRTELWEFFGGKKLPPNIRWMVFKVKKKANNNYFALTSDSKDDDRFKFDFKVGKKEPEYSYNWPYDHFSLIELAQIESGVQISPKKKSEGKMEVNKPKSKVGEEDI